MNGLTFNGKVTLVRENDLYVELENGSVGKIKNGKINTSYTVGDNVEVYIQSMCSDGVWLVTVKSNEDTVKTNEQSYISEAPSNATLDGFRLINEIIALKTHFEQEIKSAYERKEGINQYLKNQLSEFIKKKGEQKKVEADSINKNYDRFYENIDKRTYIGANILGHINEIKKDFSIDDSEIEELKNIYSNMKTMLEDEKILLGKLVDSEQRDMRSRIDAEIEAKKTNHEKEVKYKLEAADKEIDDTFSELEKNIATYAESLNSYQNNILSSDMNYENYECAKKIPNQIVLGNINAVIGDKDTEVLKQMRERMGGFIKLTDEGYELTIPYAQSIYEKKGIGFFIKYPEKNRDYVKSLMQPFLLRLFMSFQPGKIEATIIDPLDVGAGFPDISKIVRRPEDERIIDTKIWSSEKDINDALQRIRQQIENNVKAYGDNRETQWNRVPFRALIITDFPRNFSRTAIADLQVIIRNRINNGICIFIAASNESLQEYSEKQNFSLSALSEDTNALTEIEAISDVFKFKGSNIIFRPDKLHQISHKDDIIDKIRGEIESGKTYGNISFADMFRFDIYDSNNWGCGEQGQVALHLGIKGADKVVDLVVGRGHGSAEHHALITGQTGTGKSNLLHTMILSNLILYSPEQVQLYLLDFKEGVEFQMYTKYRLPSLKVVALNSEREYGLSILKELEYEFEARARIFGQHHVDGIAEYNDNKTGSDAAMPYIILIFDEAQELFRSGASNDYISTECLSLLQRFVTEGRSMGIHIILSSQDFSNCKGLKQIFSQMAIRIAVKGSEEGAASIMSEDNKGVSTLQNEPVGTAIYNSKGGIESANDFFRIAYMDREHRTKLLEEMDAYYTAPGKTEEYKNYDTRILLTNAEGNPQSCFNKLINKGILEDIQNNKNEYGLIFGQGFGQKNIFTSYLDRDPKENLIIISRDEKTALSMVEMSLLSILHEELCKGDDKSNVLINIADLFEDDGFYSAECKLSDFKDIFNDQVEIAPKARVKEMIDSLNDELMRRESGESADSERIFFIFFGISRAKYLDDDDLYESVDDTGYIAKLKNILKNGPQDGINSIMWGETTSGVENVLGGDFLKIFRKRIVFDSDENTMKTLVEEHNSKEITGKIAVFYDIDNDNKNTHFRPYEILSKQWVEKYGKKYLEFVGGDN